MRERLYTKNWNNIMNKYDEHFDFTLATKKDVPDIMNFLKEEWGETHILANDREFFLWQYGNEQYGDTDTINFVLMRAKETHELVGVNGFVAYSGEADRRNVSSAITKVKSTLTIPLCGIELIKRFKELVPADNYYSSGTNPKTMVPIGKKIFHYFTGEMQHFYMLNPEFKDFKIADIKNIHITQCEEYAYQLVNLKSIDEMDSHWDYGKRFFGQGYKSREYLRKRYWEHPVYDYSIWEVTGAKDAGLAGILIGREICAEGRTMFRIVDFLGDLELLGKTGSALRKLMMENGYEYIDLIVGTLPEELLCKSGFVLRATDDVNILPSYFEPFVRKNVVTWYQKSNQDIVIFKADGDQDRPSQRARSH